MIKVGGDSKKTEVASKDLGSFFPYFLWCLRDFTLDLSESSPDQYLERCISDVKGVDAPAQQKNKTRKHIRELFKDRGCLTFVRPVTEEAKLTRIEELSFADLRPEFRQSVGIFLQTVQNHLKPKLVGGKGVTGKILLDLAQSYVYAFNEGGCPEILPSLERAIAQEANIIVEQKLALYQEALTIKFKELAGAKDPREILPTYNAIIAKLDADLWQNSQKKLNPDLYWMPRDRIMKELKERLMRHLDEMADKKRNHVDKIKAKFGQSLVPPAKTPLETYFALPRIKEFHKGMAGWLEKALDKGIFHS